MKDYPPEEVLRQALKAMEFATRYRRKLFINDSVELALEVKAHGVHLGLKDTPVDAARIRLGSGYLLGATANTLEDIRLQAARGADYVGLGPFRFTTTKKNLSPVIGLEGYRSLVSQVRQLQIDIPLVAVGGIEMNDIEAIRAAGMQGVAISGSLWAHYMEHSRMEEI